MNVRFVPLLLATAACGQSLEIETTGSGLELPQAYRMLFDPGSLRFQGNVTRELTLAPGCAEDRAGCEARGGACLEPVPRCDEHGCDDAEEREERCEVSTPITVVCTIDDVSRMGAAMRSNLRCETDANIELAPGALPSERLLGTTTALFDANLVDGATVEKTLWMEAEPKPHERTWSEHELDVGHIGGASRLTSQGRDWIIEKSGWGPGRRHNSTRLWLRPGTGLVGGRDEAFEPHERVEIEWGEVDVQ